MSRTITICLEDLKFLRHQARRYEKARILFNVTSQCPTEIVQKRKELIEISDRYNENKIKTRVVGNKLIYPYKSVYRDEVAKPKAESILLISEEELNEVKVSTSNWITDSGNRFVANGTPI